MISLRGIASVNIPCLNGRHLRACATPSWRARRHHADEQLRAGPTSLRHRDRCPEPLWRSVSQSVLQSPDKRIVLVLVGSVGRCEPGRALCCVLDGAPHTCCGAHCDYSNHSTCQRSSDSPRPSTVDARPWLNPSRTRRDSVRVSANVARSLVLGFAGQFRCAPCQSGHFGYDDSAWQCDGAGRDQRSAVPRPGPEAQFIAEVIRYRIGQPFDRQRVDLDLIGYRRYQVLLYSSVVG